MNQKKYNGNFKYLFLILIGYQMIGQYFKINQKENSNQSNQHDSSLIWNSGNISLAQFEINSKIGNSKKDNKWCLRSFGILIELGFVIDFTSMILLYFLETTNY